MPKSHVGPLGEQLRTRIKNGRMLGSKIRKEKHTRRQEADILDQVQKALLGEFETVSRWMKELGPLKERIKLDSANAIPELEEKMHHLAMSFNVVMDLLRRRQEKYTKEAERLSKVDKSLSHFFRDTVEEVNQMSKNVRGWEQEWQIERERKGKTSVSGTDPRNPKLVGSLFTLYKYDEDADIKETFGKTKKRAAPTRGRK